jgi:hypothetical protein
MVLPSFVELPHPEQVSACKSSQAWLAARKVYGELVDHTLAPFRRFDLAADDAADLPVEVDEDGIDGLECVRLGGRDQLRDLSESAVNGRAAAHAFAPSIVATMRCVIEVFAIEVATFF